MKRTCIAIGALAAALGAYGLWHGHTADAVFCLLAACACNLGATWAHR